MYFLFAIEEEIADGYYGYRISDVFTTEAEAKKTLDYLANLNKGINYRLVSLTVYTSFAEWGKEN